MTHRPEELARLLAGAVQGELDADEQARLDAALAQDPTLRDELEQLRAVHTALRELGGQPVPLPADLESRILASTSGAPDAAEVSGSFLLRSQRFTLVAAAVLLVVGGALGGLGVRAWWERPPSGPPGTLGAVESIDFSGVPSSAQVEASLIAHTWGTETVLEMTGFDPEESYEVVLIDVDGSVWASGTFLGSDVRILCRLNAAVRRDEVVAVEIRDDDGRLIARAEVPAAVTT